VAIEDLHPEIALIERRLTSVYERAQQIIDADLAALERDPLGWRRRGRLVELRQRIEVLMRHVDQQAAA